MISSTLSPKAGQWIILENFAPDKYKLTLNCIEKESNRISAEVKMIKCVAETNAYKTADKLL